MTRKAPTSPPARARRLPPGKKPQPPVGPLGQRLFALMQAANVTQSELGRRAEVPQSRISDLLAGRVRFPRADRLRALARALGQPADALVAGFKLQPIRVHTSDGLVEAFDLGELDGKVAA